jgi:hypothetical protein
VTPRPRRGDTVVLLALTPDGHPRPHGAEPHCTHARVLAIGAGRRWARVDVCGVAVRLAIAREWGSPAGFWGELEGGGYRLALVLGERDGITGSNGRAPRVEDPADVALGERIADLVHAWPALLGQTPHVVVERTLHPYPDARYHARVRGLESGMEFYAAEGRTPRTAVRALWRKLRGPLPGAALAAGGER